MVAPRYLVLFGPATIWLLAAGAGLSVTVLGDAAWREVDRDRAEVAQSATCQRCHPAEYASWHRSYHRTMTQWATPEAVAAPFAGETLDTLGFRARMDRGEDGTPRVTVARLDEQGRPSEAVFQAAVEMTVGSHRYQQFVARIDRGGGPAERWRLPVAWHLGEQRWIHLSGAFLTPDGLPGREEDYFRHLSRWNDNCVFCHNTEPRPGVTSEAPIATEIGEVGIACEACHGPASLHVDRQASMFRRLAAPLRDGGDPAITHPARLDGPRGSEICGRCHGNRIAHDLASVLAEGDGFVPGEPLSAVSRPIFADTVLAGQPPDARPFAERFWPDGTPRLSAYEYQALLLSPCHDDGEGMQCGTCHTMHGSEPAMQLRSDYDPRATCQACHPDARLSQGARHGGHADLDCVPCHMPRVTYGLLEGMISHRVTVPDPAAWIGRADMPDACTQCHVDRSRAWAAAAMPELVGRAELRGEAEPAPAASRVELDLVGGDPVQRALAAHALTRAATPAPPAFRARALVDALEDEYPAVRWFGWRGLRAVVPALADDEAAARLEAASPWDDPAERTALVQWLRDRFGPSTLAADPARFERLQAERDDKAIEIGE